MVPVFRVLSLAKMPIRSAIKKLLDVDAHFTGEQNTSDNFLAKEGNQVHAGLIYIEAAYGAAFAVITYVQGYYYQSWLNLALFLAAGLAFIIQKKGYPFASKLFNLLQVTVVLALMFYFPSTSSGQHINDSVLAFYIPVSVGTLIAFQGKERKYGFMLAVLILLVMLLLIFFDLHYKKENPAEESKFSYDLLYNIVGAALATFTEVAYILALNNRLNFSLIKANQELDNFVYIVSHDLRSPLLSSKGLLDLAKNKSAGNEQALRYIDLSSKSIGKLDETIREILDYSRNSRTVLTKERFDLKLLVKEIFDSLRFSTPAAFSFFEEYTGSTIVYADKARLHTVLRNIVGNSVKYSNKNSSHPFVRISFTGTSAGFTLVVTDNGEGIRPECIDHVFEMFYRGNSTAQGSGLGLYICKEILEKMGAAYTLESKEGEGTSFTINMPFSG